MVSIRPAFAFCCLALPVLAVGQQHHGHGHDHVHQPGVHQHGVGALNLALDGSTLEIELTGPADNFLGFEHQPSSDAERERAQRALDNLRQPGSLFILPAEARCIPQAVSIQSALLEGIGSDGAEHEHHEHEHEHAESTDVHQDITAHYRFRCENPGAIEQIELAVFRVFPHTERLLLQSVGTRGQLGGEATASQPVVKL